MTIKFRQSAGMLLAQLHMQYACSRGRGKKKGIKSGNISAGMLEANDLSDLLMDTRGAFLKEKIGFFVHLYSLWRYNEEIELFSP